VIGVISSAEPLEFVFLILFALWFPRETQIGRRGWSWVRGAMYKFDDLVDVGLKCAWTGMAYVFMAAFVAGMWTLIGLMFVSWIRLLIAWT
jgi:hypothetical protein